MGHKTLKIKVDAVGRRTYSNHLLWAVRGVVEALNKLILDEKR
jgi:hypothetical protein